MRRVRDLREVGTATPGGDPRMSAAGPVVIAGGGIGGLTLAAGLKRGGLPALVLEGQDSIREAGAGISLWPNALGALDAIGLGEVVRGAGRSISQGGQRRLDGGRGPYFSSRAFVRALGEGLVCVDRGKLVRALADCLRPGTVRTGCAVVGFEQGQESVKVRVEGKGEVEAAALIGADGINSVVASRLNGGLAFSYSGYTAWRGTADTRFDPGHDRIEACLAGGREFGWMPVDEDRTYWFATAWLPEGFVPAEGDSAYLVGLFAGGPPSVIPLVESTPAGQLLRNDIVDRAPLERWCDRRVAVVGDAAHPMRPHLGQGGCQAIEDAAAVAALMQSGGDVTEALAGYQASRRPRAERIVRLSRRAGFTRPPGVVTSLLDRLGEALPAVRIDLALRGLASIAGYGAGLEAARAG